MEIIRVSETLHGRPLVEIDQVPLDDSGTLYVSEELAELLLPHMNDADNIAVKFTSGNGLPTTVTAVVSEIHVKIGNPPDMLRCYSVRAMIFTTPTGKHGVNVFFKPVRTEFIKLPIGQAIDNAPVFNFKEVYNHIEDTSDDMPRLVKIADDAYQKSQQKEEENAPSRKEYLKKSALGLASFIDTNRALSELIESNSKDDRAIANMAIGNFRQEGVPYLLKDIHTAAAEFIITEKLGWFGRNQFKSDLYFNLTNIFKFSIPEARQHILAIEGIVKQLK